MSTHEHLYRWEYTDTFAGEANYCWVKRGIIRDSEAKRQAYTPDHWRATQRRILKAAKREAGLTGVRCERRDFGDMVAYYPHGMCTVLFVMINQEFFAVDGDPEPVEA